MRLSRHGGGARLAAQRAFAGLGLTADMVLLDGNWDFAGTGNVVRIVRGDACCLSIAAASILAKVTRDRHMRALAPNYPHYEFQDNKGYPCWRHNGSPGVRSVGHPQADLGFHGRLSWDMRVTASTRSTRGWEDAEYEPRSRVQTPGVWGVNRADHRCRRGCESPLAP